MQYVCNMSPEQGRKNYIKLFFLVLDDIIDPRRHMSTSPLLEFYNGYKKTLVVKFFRKYSFLAGTRENQRIVQSKNCFKYI